MNTVKGIIKRNNLDIQFWGYEGGNVLATIAGAGGFERFFTDVGGVITDGDLGLLDKVLTISRHHPDGFVTIALGIVILLVPAIQKLVNDRGGRFGANIAGAAIVIVSIGILVFALASDASWITASAASFVVASGFLRQSGENPFLFKMGGLALAIGGVALAAFGIEEVRGGVGGSAAIGIGLSMITTGTGLYVIAASVLTYRGGIFETHRYRAEGLDSPMSLGWIGRLTHPTRGALPLRFEAVLDRPILWINTNIVDPAIFWVPDAMKEQKPLATSMWARLPWRLAAIGLALASGTAQGAAFALANAGWVLGDVSIGSLDWEERRAADLRS